MKRTVINLLRQASEQFGDAAYLNQKGNDGWESESFNDVLEKSGHFALALLQAGINPGDRIAMIVEGRNDWIITEYGILRAGCINVPLSIKLLPEEIQFRLSHAECRAIIFSSNTIESVLKSIDTKQDELPLLIYIDDNIDKYEELLESFGLKAEKDFFFLQSMYENGKSLASTGTQKLDDIEDNIKEDQVVTISYTSGTTGNPKGIMLTHLNYWANSTDSMSIFDVNKGDKLMLILPLDHSFAHTVGIYGSAVKGLSIYFADARNGNKSVLKNIPKNLKEANPHFMLTVPALTGSFMNKMKEGVGEKGKLITGLFEKGVAAGIKLYGNGFNKAPSGSIGERIAYKIAYNLIFKKLQKVFGDNFQFNVGGGALLDISQQQFFAAIGAPVFQGYGLTEATPIISANTPGRHKLGTSGMVLPGIECKIVDDAGKTVPNGVKGEIVIRGNNVMKGYYNNPEATAEVIRDGWLFSGDLGYIDEDDFLVVVGREKALLISSAGEKYSPEGIEEAIMNSSELVSQVMVYNDMSPYTVAVINLEHGKINELIKEQNLSNPEQLLEQINKSFYSYKTTEVYKGQIPEIWAPQSFIIGKEDFSEQNQMINSTMKMVRHKVLKYYKKEVDFMYSKEGNQPLNQINLDNLQALYFKK